MGIDLRVWDNGKIIKLNQAEFIDRGSLSSDSRFNMHAYTVKEGFKSLFDLFTKAFVK